MSADLDAHAVLDELGVPRAREVTAESITDEQIRRVLPMNTGDSDMHHAALHHRSPVARTRIAAAYNALPAAKRQLTLPERIRLLGAERDRLRGRGGRPWEQEAGLMSTIPCPTCAAPLEILPPEPVVAYLERTGWRRAAAPDAIALEPVWRVMVLDGEEIAVPMRSDARDYPRRWIELLRDLSRLESRPVSAILADMRAEVT